MRLRQGRSGDRKLLWLFVLSNGVFLVDSFAQIAWKRPSTHWCKTLRSTQDDTRRRSRRKTPLDLGSTLSDNVDNVVDRLVANDVDFQAKLTEIRDQMRLAMLQSDDQGRQPRSKQREGLSRFHQSILDRSYGRQRFVTGKFPLLVSVKENPTKRWLANADTGTAQLLLNGTAVDTSLASFDRFQWLDDEERDELAERYSMVSLELVGEINIKKPGYVNLMPSNAAGSSAAVRRTISQSKGWNKWKNSELYEQLAYEYVGTREEESPRERLWITGFSLASPKGFLHSLDTDTGNFESVDARTARSVLWPNESNAVPRSLLGGDDDDGDKTFKHRDALLVSDGFLVPGKDRGGLYVVQCPGNPDAEWTVCLTASSENWFYHRAVWVDLTGDGRKSILTARARTPVTGGDSGGQLVWLEAPQPHRYDEATGTPLAEDGTVFDPFSARHTPWKTR